MIARVCLRRPRATATLTALLLATLLPPAARGLTPLGALRYTPDTPVDLSGTIVNHNQAAQDNLAGAVNLVAIGAIPSSAIVTGYDVLDDGDQLLSFDTDVELPGPLTARPGDVVRFDGTTFSLLFDATANGVPRGTVVDAVSAIGPDDVLLSFDVPVALGTITAFGRDVVRFHDGVYSLFFDGGTAGVAPDLNLDGLHCIQQNAHLLMTFDGRGTLGGVVFRANDVLEYTPGSGTFELAYNGESEHAGWHGANLLDAFAITSPPESIVAPVIGDPATTPPRENTVIPGSTRVSGRGTARAKPGDTCIQIWEAGPNGVPDTPPGSVDDILLGTGGTDANGNFVAPDGSFGIPVPPLHGGQRLFAVDTCAGLTSAIVAIIINAAPLLSPSLSAALALLLGALGVTCVRRRAVARGDTRRR